jgi:hypothetical protein
LLNTCIKGAAFIPSTMLRIITTDYKAISLEQSVIVATSTCLIFVLKYGSSTSVFPIDNYREIILCHVDGGHHFYGADIRIVNTWPIFKFFRSFQSGLYLVQLQVSVIQW